MTEAISTNSPSSPFHKGERHIQQKLGVRDKIERMGRRAIRSFLTEQHRDFYSGLKYAFLGYADRDGRPWASILFKQSGLLTSSDNRTLRIHAKPVAGDPLNEATTAGTRLGLLGIDLSSRRRNRVSGIIDRATTDGMELRVVQAFGNCPKYIQARAFRIINPETLPPSSAIELNRLDTQATGLIGNSDTFFVASHMANGGEASGGADVSHRGGNSGFIRIDDDRCLTIPDYQGNNYFNTLGNFLENPRAGLLFIDFNNGNLLTMTGTVEILWDSPDISLFPGAHRLWTFRLERGLWLNNTLPLRWSPPQ